MTYELAMYTCLKKLQRCFKFYNDLHKFVKGMETSKKWLATSQKNPRIDKSVSNTFMTSLFLVTDHLFSKICIVQIYVVIKKMKIVSWRKTLIKSFVVFRIELNSLVSCWVYCTVHKMQKVMQNAENSFLSTCVHNK